MWLTCRVHLAGFQGAQEEEPSWAPTSAWPGQPRDWVELAGIIL